MLLKIVFFRFLNLILFVSIFCANLIFAIAHESEFISLRKPCRIEVVERGTNCPVSLVEFRTTHQQRFVTDNAGVIALDSPELIGRETWFDINGYGYSVKKDGFGISGVRLTPEYGKTIRVEVYRDIIARRVGRLTGAGILAESQKLGEYSQLRETGIFGCDSIQTAIYRGRLFWIWGDTTIARYPLGIFHSTAATTDIIPFSNLQAPLFLSYKYFTDSADKPRGIAEITGDGPTWLSGCVTLTDKNGKERLTAVYAKIIPPLEVYEYGLCVWNDDKNSFQHLRTIWNKKKNPNLSKPIVPEGHAIKWTDKSGNRWVLFGNPFPTLRCPATFESWQNPETWQKLETSSKLISAEKKLSIEAHSGSIVWSEFRKCWIAIFVQKFGKPSAFGEVWYAESDAPTGQWGEAVKILSHGNYTFYNPYIHEESRTAEKKTLLFEGTFSAMFADKPETVPRYDYNQILYRLDLDNPKLIPAQKQKVTAQGL